MANKIKSAINFQKGFSQAVAENQKTWMYDRSLTAGASEVFECWRQLYFKKRQPELIDSGANDEEWGHAERGNLVENSFVVPCLQSMFGKDNCFYMGEDQQTLLDDRLSATPDGIVVDLARDALSEYGVDDIGPSGMIATEIKSFGGEYAAPKRLKIADENDKSLVHLRYEPRPKHVGQNIIQMGLFRRKTNYQPEYGVVIYVNPVNLKDIRVGAVKYDENVYIRAKSRATAVFKPEAEAKNFPAEGLVKPNGCQYCQFTDACNAVEMAKFPDKIRKAKDFTPEEYKEVELIARRLANIRKVKKSAEEEEKVVVGELKEKLFDMDTNKAAGDGWSCSLSQNKGRMSTDMDKIVEDTGIDLEDYQTQGNPYYVMRAKSED